MLAQQAEGLLYRLVCTPGTGGWSPSHTSYLGRKITTTIMSSIFISMCQLRRWSYGRKLNVTFRCWCDTNTHILHKLLHQWLLLAVLWCEVTLKKEKYKAQQFFWGSNTVFERFWKWAEYDKHFWTYPDGHKLCETLLISALPWTEHRIMTEFSFYFQGKIYNIMDSRTVLHYALNYKISTRHPHKHTIQDSNRIY